MFEVDRKFKIIVEISVENYLLSYKEFRFWLDKKKWRQNYLILSPIHFIKYKIDCNLKNYIIF